MRDDNDVDVDVEKDMEKLMGRDYYSQRMLMVLMML